MKSRTAKRNKLSDNPFHYQITNSQTILLYYKNKLIKTLGEKDAKKFIAKVKSKSEYEVQFELAKITGNFKRGNEKTINKIN